jgi:hypothetical protein
MAVVRVRVALKRDLIESAVQMLYALGEMQ